MGTEGDDAGLGDLQLVASLERDVARETARARLFGGAPSTRTVSRFHLLERVGSGSMGTVYAAYDPELDRRLAIKLLDGRRTGPAAARRMVTEARAMATRGPRMRLVSLSLPMSAGVIALRSSTTEYSRSKTSAISRTGQPSRSWRTTAER